MRYKSDLLVRWKHSANSYLYYERRLIQMIRRVSKNALTYSYWLQRTCWTHDKISSKKLTNKNWQPILTIPKHQDTNIRYSLFHIGQGYYGGNSARDEVLRNSCHRRTQKFWVLCKDEKWCRSRFKINLSILPHAPHPLSHSAHFPSTPLRTATTSYALHHFFNCGGF